VSDQSRHVTLNNGVQMPILGFGVYQIPPDQTEQAVTDALATGYRHLDTAEAYQNEEAVGRAIASGGIPRDELFVTTKLWVQDGGEDGAKRAFEQSLARLGLDYLDLYLIHQPFGDYYSSWRAMQDLCKQGLIKAIGVANFYPDRLVDLVDHNDITPAVNQVETHPFFQRQDYQQLMGERGVQLESCNRREWRRSRKLVFWASDQGKRAEVGNPRSPTPGGTHQGRDQGGDWGPIQGGVEEAEKSLWSGPRIGRNQ
jgi:2,5-diketo-D-gluconate reductase A